LKSAGVFNMILNPTNKILDLTDMISRWPERPEDLSFGVLG
jgi:hypothetical protein